jgi:hypothetical protein
VAEKGPGGCSASRPRANHLPAELVDSLIDAESPVRVWREHRRMTLGNLADRVGIAPSYLSEIE